MDLLVVLADAHRGVDVSRRGEFYWLFTIGSDVRPQVVHHGLPGGRIHAVFGDIEELARAGLLHLRPKDRGSGSFGLTNAGLRAAADYARRGAESMEAPEVIAHRYLEAEAFATRYPSARTKWLAADALLRSSAAESQLSMIGHLCREAFQEFAGALCQYVGVADVPADPGKTVARVKACIDARKASVGDKIAEFLEALFVYWGRVSDLAQRQEHGGTKEGRALTLEDGRRVVFHTAITMYELDRALARQVGL
jgi:hypothetical protein